MATPEKTDVQYQIHSCYICDKGFARSSSMYRHIRNFHKENMKFPTAKSIICPLCPENKRESFTNYKKLHMHMTAKHDLKLEIEKHKFRSLDEFVEWKTQLEKETKAQYVKQNGTKKCGDIETLRYYCNRSGFYKPTGHKKRQLKKQGSNKINSCCPSMIKASINSKTNETEVEFVVNHVGHVQELDHLFLTKAERQWIAEQLEEGADISNILEKVRSNQEGDKTRFNLLTRKDVLNINKNTAKAKQRINIDAWLEDVQKSNEKLILFYKPQGLVAENFPQLEVDDFFLALMNDNQADVLRQLVSQSVSLVTVQGSYLFGVYMSVMIITDNDNASIPVAMLFSSKIDEPSLRMFLLLIQNEVGTITTKVFMSDDSEDYINAWNSVMGEFEHRILCPWQVERAWEKNLPKVKAKKLKVCKMLRKLLQETNERVFTDMINNTIEQLNTDQHTKEFAQFFFTNYANRPKEWANCYRLSFGISATKQQETIYKTMRQIYIQGKKVRCLGKTIDALMVFLRDYHTEKLMLVSDYITKTLNRIEDRHDTHSDVKCKEIAQFSDSVSWTLTSESEECCTVTWVKKECLCNLKCIPCNKCVHNFTCTCSDNQLYWNMCRHIHTLCTTLLSNVVQQTEIEAMECIGIEQQELVVQVDTVDIEANLGELKEKVIKDLETAIENIRNVRNYEALENFHAASCKPMCEALEGMMAENSVIAESDPLQALDVVYLHFSNSL